MYARKHVILARQRAFTLVELLVVMTIIVVLATLSYFLLPGLLGHQKASDGADKVQQWLLIAKQRALRDGLPRGVRLHIDTDDMVRTLEYIERPQDFSKGFLEPDTSNSIIPPILPPPAGQHIRFKVREVLAADWQPLSNAPVQTGDYLLIPALEPTARSWHRITNVGFSQDLPPVPYIDIDRRHPVPAALPSPYLPTSDFLISRAPRPLTGEEMLQMPQDVVIDMKATGKSVPRLPPGSSSLPPGSTTFDILFSPSGGVLYYPSGGFVGSAAKIILWVHDIPTDPNALPLEETLIAVYVRPGLIAAHPVDPTNPYLFTQDGRSSGL